MGRFIHAMGLNMHPSLLWAIFIKIPCRSYGGGINGTGFAGSVMTGATGVLSLFIFGLN
jgi:hypothetical protein